MMTLSCIDLQIPLLSSLMSSVRKRAQATTGIRDYWSRKCNLGRSPAEEASCGVVRDGLMFEVYRPSRSLKRGTAIEKKHSHFTALL